MIRYILVDVNFEHSPNFSKIPVLRLGRLDKYVRDLILEEDIFEQEEHGKERTTSMSILLFTLGSVGFLMSTMLFLSGLAPTREEYTEYIEINAPAATVWDDIRIQVRLMRWSAWPRETKSYCAVDPGPTGEDGNVGSRTVFVSKGKTIGHQKITEVRDQREIVMTLEGPGPPHRPTLRFVLENLDTNRTGVHLHFVNELPRPFNAIWKFAGLSKWTLEMHLKDLRGLKAFSEPPHLDADGRVVGRDLHTPNPYAVPLPASEPSHARATVAPLQTSTKPEAVE